VAEIRGWKHPDEVVLVSGHIDSWDVGQGAMDDAGPAFVALQAPSRGRCCHFHTPRCILTV
jgi:carboxypeptidase Q